MGRSSGLRTCSTARRRTSFSIRSITLDGARRLTGCPGPERVWPASPWIACRAAADPTTASTGVSFGDALRAVVIGEDVDRALKDDVKDLLSDAPAVELFLVHLAAWGAVPGCSYMSRVHSGSLAAPGRGRAQGQVRYTRATRGSHHRTVLALARPRRRARTTRQTRSVRALLPSTFR